MPHGLCTSTSTVYATFYNLYCCWLTTSTKFVLYSMEKKVVVSLGKRKRFVSFISSIEESQDSDKDILKKKFDKSSRTSCLKPMTSKLFYR